MGNNFDASGLFNKELVNDDFYLKTLNSCPMGVLVFDENTLLVAANDFMLNLLSAEKTSVVGKRFCDVFLCSSVNKDEDCKTCPIIKTVKTVLSNNAEVTVDEVPHEFIKNGRCDTVWFKLNAVPYAKEGSNYVIVTLADITKQKYLQSNLKHLGITDGQTLLYYRKYITEQLEILTSDADLVNSPLSIVMMDIDNMEEINENQGIEVGDEIISTLAQLITKTIRHTDYAGRYGGEEYLLLLPDTAKEGGAALSERLTNSFSAKRFGTMDKPVTFSAGILEINDPDININTFLVNAKILLLRNKEDRTHGWNAATMDDFE